MPLTAETDGPVSGFALPPGWQCDGEAQADPGEPDALSDGERALVRWLLLGRMAHPKVRASQGQVMQTLLDEAVKQFGQPVIARFLRDTGVRIAGAFPLPRPTTAEVVDGPGREEDPALDTVAAEFGDRTGNAGMGRRFDTRRFRPNETEGDAYLFALLEGLYGAWFSRLDTMARIDGLTGIANRREFDRCLPIAWAAAAQRGEPLALIMIDVDLFKPFNDRYGHLAGDDCLRGVARAIEHTLRRSGDLVARYGGEEFVVVLQADAAGARKVAESIRQAIRAAAIPHDDSIGDGCITVSLGIAVCTPPSNMRHDDLTRVADEALYNAKRAGRDRAVLVEIG